jgi:hypothetical protein
MIYHWTALTAVHGVAFFVCVADGLKRSMWYPPWDDEVKAKSDHGHQFWLTWLQLLLLQQDHQPKASHNRAPRLRVLLSIETPLWIKKLAERNLWLRRGLSAKLDAMAYCRRGTEICECSSGWGWRKMNKDCWSLCNRTPVGIVSTDWRFLGQQAVRWRESMKTTCAMGWGSNIYCTSHGPWNWVLKTGIKRTETAGKSFPPSTFSGTCTFFVPCLRTFPGWVSCKSDSFTTLYRKRLRAIHDGNQLHISPEESFQNT